MISFLYQGHTFYANVIRYNQAPPTYYISIVTPVNGIPRKLILVRDNDEYDLSIFSPSLATQDLVSAIAQKLKEHELKAGMAQKQ